jgi:hypothetical protein
MLVPWSLLLDRKDKTLLPFHNCQQVRLAASREILFRYACEHVAMEVGRQLRDTRLHVLKPWMEVHPHPGVPAKAGIHVHRVRHFVNLNVLEEVAHPCQAAVECEDDGLDDLGQLHGVHMARDEEEVVRRTPKLGEGSLGHGTGTKMEDATGLALRVVIGHPEVECHLHQQCGIEAQVIEQLSNVVDGG